MMKPSAAAEFLTLHFHPNRLIQALQSDPSTMLCDAAQFNKSFSFAPGVDTEEIQTELCSASQNNSLIMQQVWDLLDLKALFTDATKPPTESPFKSMLKQIKRVLQNANIITRLIQAFNRDMPDVASYLQMALSTVSTMADPNANNIGGMCDALVNLIDETSAFETARPQLVRIQLVNSIIAEFATSLDSLDDFLCDLPSMNLSSLLLKAANSKLINIPDVIRKVEDENYLASARFTCSAMVRDAMLPQAKIQNMIQDAMNGSFDVCIQKLATENITLLQDLNSYVGVLKGLRDLLTTDSIIKLKWLDPIRPLLTEVLTGLLDQVCYRKF